ncbi:MAG: hypothetical protein CM15mP113_2080 [Pseudomonadota bacterium]|nr:MAG: hypothetical protein CM15mP113_2080 [Pseudomonadota bacterium]
MKSVTGAASTTYNTISDVDGFLKVINKSIKWKVHLQFIKKFSLRDNDDILTIQYPLYLLVQLQVLELLVVKLWE